MLLLACVFHHAWGLRCTGEDDGCCTDEKPCDVGEGDCDSDSECMDGLTCGDDNCPWGDGDDCCFGTKSECNCVYFVHIFLIFFLAKKAGSRSSTRFALKPHSFSFRTI